MTEEEHILYLGKGFIVTKLDFFERPKKKIPQTASLHPCFKGDQLIGDWPVSDRALTWDAFILFYL